MRSHYYRIFNINQMKNMWKQKIRTCAINLMAYSIALVIIVMLSDCLRLYGQENCVQSFGRTYNIVTDMDSAYSYKLSFNEYGKPFLFPHFTGIGKNV